MCEIAKENKLTTINLVESGAQIYQIRILYSTTMVRYLKKCPLEVKRYSNNFNSFGNATAGGAYFPGMSDYTIMQEDQAKVF